MDILTKKTINNPSGFISQEELLASVDTSKLTEMIKTLEARVLKLEEDKQEITGLDILKLLTDNNTLNLSAVTIEATGSIEKDKNVKQGTIYFNKTQNVFRGKVKDRWVNLNI